MSNKALNKQGMRCILTGIFMMAAQIPAHAATIDYTTFLQRASDGIYKQVIINGPRAQGVSAINDALDDTNIPDGESLSSHIKGHTKIIAGPPETGKGIFKDFIINILPSFALVIAFAYFISKKRPGQPSSYVLSDSKAKKVTTKVKFSDVAGIDEVKEELKEIVDFLKNPGKYTSIGGNVPKGALLVGPPGTGKTLLAKAIAGEAGVPFYSISGSNFVEMFVGVGASRVRTLFSEAKAAAPSIIFIDEIDAVGRARGSGVGGGNDEKEQTLNQLLVEMDGFEENENVIVVAATNRPDILDKALLRPGRFDRHVHVSLPDVAGREEILAVHAKKVKLQPDVDLYEIAKGTPGFSGADLANLVNEAALLAARLNSDSIHKLHFDLAKDKIIMGTERRSLAITEDEKRLTAYHEAGHAIAAWYTPGAMSVYKATILPRGRTLGAVHMLPDGDQISISFEQMKASLVVAMAGRVAEEIIFGNSKVTTGASGDIEQATKLARSMIREWGMSDKLGAVLMGSNISEDLAFRIDEEVKKVINDAKAQACTLLTDNKEKLDRLAEALLTNETLDRSMIGKILDGEYIAAPGYASPDPSAPVLA